MKAKVLIDGNLFMEINVHNNHDKFHYHMMNNGFTLVTDGYRKDNIEVIMY